ncbi:kinase-like domain-containing protein [Haematococcus lacustris]
MAAASDLFAHRLIWALMTEQRPPEEAFNPEVKRSGWQPPRDFGLWDVATSLAERVLAGLSPASRQYWDAEAGYFDKVTAISGILKKLDKDARRAKIASELATFQPERPDLYIPTNIDCRVLGHIPTSGTPMQSAAKVPILVAFQVEQQPDGQPVTSSTHHTAACLASASASTQGQQPAAGEGSMAEGNGQQQGGATTTTPGAARTVACIFKVGDDVRQDVLALQVVQLLKAAYDRAGLPVYLRPYGCLPTGYEKGIIEVVPNSRSRASLGELSDKGLYDIFQAEFGLPGSPSFEAARSNFIASQAGYAIASYLLQAKDRHNGNLLVSKEGHLVHIDFGFILEISPGGNMGFESAAFKLSHEMTQLLDPGGARTSAVWAQFEELCVRAYLAARTVAEPIVSTVALMASSGLPCYSRGHPVENLRKRFHLEMTDRQAAVFMRATIADAYQKWTTGFYDYIQALQNRIPY